MRNLVLAAALVFLLPASRAFAHDCDNDFGFKLGSACNPPSRIGPRLDAQDARFAITTDDGQAALMLTNKYVAMQLTDRAFHDVRRKFKDLELEDDNALAHAIKSVVLSSVEAILDHSIECRIRDIDDVQYRDGRLVFTTVDDDQLFQNIDVHDRNVLEGFSEADAKAFVREFRKAKERMTL
jgi:hypothetical protein